MTLDTGMSRFDTSEEDYYAQFGDEDESDPGDPIEEDEDDDK